LLYVFAHGNQAGFNYLNVVILTYAKRSNFKRQLPVGEFLSFSLFILPFFLPRLIFLSFSSHFFFLFVREQLLLLYFFFPSFSLSSSRRTYICIKDTYRRVSIYTYILSINSIYCAHSQFLSLKSMKLYLYICNADRQRFGWGEKERLD
jgi:hypothetical protein